MPLRLFCEITQTRCDQSLVTQTTIGAKEILLIGKDIDNIETRALRQPKSTHFSPVRTLRHFAAYISDEIVELFNAHVDETTFIDIRETYTTRLLQSS